MSVMQSGGSPPPSPHWPSVVLTQQDRAEGAGLWVTSPGLGSVWFASFSALVVGVQFELGRPEVKPHSC